LEDLLEEISGCEICKAYLPLGPNPVVTASRNSEIMIVGQAPGTRVHKTGIPWNDPSGDRLREWMGLSRADFYDTERIALVPMAFCYPGRGKSGDLPPRKECAPQWHELILTSMPKIKLIMLVGSYSINYYLGKRKKKTLTETVRNFEEYLPEYAVLPHPSPRNNIWLKKNEWFEDEIVPKLRRLIHNFK